MPAADLAVALEASAAKTFSGGNPPEREVERYLRGLHLEDLALACACAAGREEAWDHFVREYRPILYRAADALAAGGAARETADSLYADLYGIRERNTERPSLLRYYHGRSSLATWLRAVLAQRHVDRIRAIKHLDPLPDDESPGAIAAKPAAVAPDPDRTRYIALLLAALRAAIDGQAPADRLRFACYYADGLTLAETGRILGEHEATVSRQLAKTRKALRAAVEQSLRGRARLSAEQIARAFELAAEDSGPFDLGRWATRKEAEDDRSQ